MCDKFGGIGLRRMNTIIVSANITAVHKTIKKVGQETNAEMLYFTNNEIREQHIKLIIIIINWLKINGN